jgi:hypothetical protein
MIIFCIIQLASHHLLEFAYLAVSIPVFIAADSRISTTVDSIAHSSRDFYRFPISLIPILVVLLSIPVPGFLLFRDPSFNSEPSLHSAYFRSLIFSVAFFSLTSAFRCLYIFAYRNNFQHILSDILGLFQRGFILIRNFVLFFVWIPAVSSPYLFSIFTFLKVALGIWQIFDLCVAGRNFWSNRSSLWEPVPESEVTDICCVCQDRPSLPVRLQCRHICCYGCLDTWLRSKSECPLCRRPTAQKRAIEFADGELPLEVLFAAF